MHADAIAHRYRWWHRTFWSLGLLLLGAALVTRGQRPYPSAALLAMALGTASMAVQGWRSGALPSRFGRLYQYEHPRAFWFSLIVYILMALGYAFFGVWLFGRGGLI